jgi:hypothetical protein
LARSTTRGERLSYSWRVPCSDRGSSSTCCSIDLLAGSFEFTIAHFDANWTVQISASMPVNRG